MALIDDAVLGVALGRFYTAPVGTAMPADPLTPGAAWSEVGHTSLDDIMSFDSEGGEATTLGTLQKKNLRSRYSPRVERFSINLQQFDEGALKLFYGANATVDTNGLLGVPEDPVPTVCAFLGVFQDGDVSFPIYAPKAEIFRSDNMEISDTESLVSLPINITPLSHEGGAAYYVGVLTGEASEPDEPEGP